MVRQHSFVWLAGLVVALAACSGADKQEDEKGTMTVQGTVAQSLTAKDMAAVALSQDGHAYWSVLATNGDFKLLVPSGQSYRLFLSKPIAGGGADALVGRLAFKSVAGKTSWFAAHAGVVLRLGTVVPLGTTSTASSIGTRSGDIGSGSRGGDIGSGSRGGDASGTDNSGSGRGGSDCSNCASGEDDHDDFADDQEHADDEPCHEKDDAQACGATNVPEVESSRNDADDVASKCDFGDHSADENESAESCGGAGANGSGTNGSTTNGGTTNGGTTASGSTPADVGGATGSAPADPAAPSINSDGTIILR